MTAPRVTGLKTCIKCGETKRKTTEFLRERSEAGRIYKDVCIQCTAASMPSKTCSECGETRPLTDYHVRDGGVHRRGICKVCANAKKRAQHQLIKTKPNLPSQNFYNPFEWRTYVQPSIV